MAPGAVHDREGTAGGDSAPLPQPESAPGGGCCLPVEFVPLPGPDFETLSRASILSHVKKSLLGLPSAGSTAGCGVSALWCRWRGRPCPPPHLHGSRLQNQKFTSEGVTAVRALRRLSQKREENMATSPMASRPGPALHARPAVRPHSRTPGPALCLVRVRHRDT